MRMTLDDIRRFAVARSLFPPTSLKRALHRLGFVQADPIRAPARAQDLTLRHRVRGYRAGDLERRYAELGLEEDFFLNYGFLTRPLQALMHPRSDCGVPADSPAPWPAARRKKAELLLAFVRERGAVHPREVDDHFSHGTVRNYWGGSSSATTHLLDAMHYRGWLRVARREGGVRVYTAHEHGPEPTDAAGRRGRLDALVDVAVRIYAPLPGRSLSNFVRRLRFAVPQWRGELKGALLRARSRLSQARVDGIDWYWPAGEDPVRSARQDIARLLTPFDPVVHDRDRFELLWGWVYRFEAYTPAPKRKLGYYALP
ncbi:MAG TPA: crosslink repair DNA glycosylase YcaQ family protein, partial [Thermoanaerobaculia bacterium]|nr:crosslink repair DNA glycosylase YcaQ family protein [Thermoanaerobaculia bacterium]